MLVKNIPQLWALSAVGKVFKKLFPCSDFHFGMCAHVAKSTKEVQCDLDHVFSLYIFLNSLLPAERY